MFYVELYTIFYCTH